MLDETQRVLNRLAAADRTHQKEAGGRFALRSVGYLCVALVALFALDVALHLSPLWRLGLILGLFAAVALLLAGSFFIAFVRCNPPAYIARFLEKRDPALGSRLINLLQLQGQTSDPTLRPITRDLAQQAVGEYTAALHSAPLEQLAWTGAVRRHLKQAAWILLAFALLLGVFHRVTTIELARFGDPFGEHPPFSFTRLAIVEPGTGGTNILYGKGLVLQARAWGHTPKELFLTTHPPDHPEAAVTVPMFDKGDGVYHQMVDQVQTELVAFVHTKNHKSLSKSVRIGVVLTPQLEQALVQITPPAYTGLPPVEKPYAFKGLQALTGSQVRFRLQSNRPLREGALEFAAADQPLQRILLSQAAGQEVSGSFTAAVSGRFTFSLTDTQGLPSQGDWSGPLTVTYDLPPEVRIVEPRQDAMVAMDFQPEIHIEARDDYGLSSLRFHRGLNGEFSTPKTTAYDTVTRDGQMVEKLDFAAMGVQPGDVISLFAEAVDTAPEKHVARSQVLRLMVVSVEDYNNFLREQLDIADMETKYRALMDALERLVEEQKELSKSAQELRNDLAQSKGEAKEDLTRAWDGLVARQNEVNQKLNQHAERMSTFVRDQPLYDVERDLQERLEEQARNVRDSARTNSASVRQLAERSAPADAARVMSTDMLEQFARAADDQVQRLGGTQEATQQQVAQTLKDMSQLQELLKDFNRFEALYRAQEELAAVTQAYHRAEPLEREDQLALKELAAKENEIGEAIGELRGRLLEDAKAAENLFPKAARSARDLAGQFDKLRLQPLARQATSRMLAGQGEESYLLSERLRSEMATLFSQCQGSGNCPSGDELDTYLRLQRNMNPGQSFAQMSKSRKFGLGHGQGRGMGGGLGTGFQTKGSSGYAVAGGSAFDVMGNEAIPQGGNTTAKPSSRQGQGQGTMAAGTGDGISQPADAMTGLNPINRMSGVVSSESTIAEYDQVVDEYFKAITTRGKP